MYFNVKPEKIGELKQRMKRLGIRERDIVEKFIRSRGHGGQKVNKTSSCVYLKHIPTGIEVKCRRTRSQSINRFFARRYLVEKIEKLMLGKESALEKIKQKKRKQKLRRKKKSRKKYDPLL